MTFAGAFRNSHRAACDGLSADLALAGARILLVSSEELARARLIQSLSAASAAVTAVCSHDEALALLRIGYRPGLVLIHESEPSPIRQALAEAIAETSAPGAVTILTITGGA